MTHEFDSRLAQLPLPSTYHVIQKKTTQAQYVELNRELEVWMSTHMWIDQSNFDPTQEPN